MIKIAGSPGNDLDLYVYECAKDAQVISDPTCLQVGKADGPTDEESASFMPRAGRVYMARVDGVDVKNEGTFICRETLFFDSEKMSLGITERSGAYDVNYAMSASQIDASKLMNHEGFRSGKYEVVGTLSLKATDNTALSMIPIGISSVRR
jgi:hypothetical protein